MRTPGCPRLALLRPAQPAKPLSGAGPSPRAGRLRSPAGHELCAGTARRQA